MTEMIERVARAITVAEGDDPDGKTGSLLNEGEVWWQHRIPQARAAIEAMREPPSDLDVSGIYEEVDLADPGACLGPAGLATAWRAMMDAALGLPRSP